METTRLDVTVKCEDCGWWISPIYHQLFRRDRFKRYSYWRWLEQLVHEHTESCPGNLAAEKAVR